MSASVCRTESCTRAAISARSSVRIRAARSASRSAASRQAHGPRTSRSAIATALGCEGSVAAVRRRVLVDEDDHADGDEREADDERGAAAAAGEQDPCAAERGRPDQRVREPEAAERDRARDARAPNPSTRRRGDGAGPSSGASASQAPPYATIPAPPANASSANVEPDERGVDPQALGDPAQTPASARSLSARRRRGRASGSRYGVELNRAAPRRCRCRRPLRASSTGASGVDPAKLTRPVCVDAVVAPAEHVDLADSGLGVDLERDVLGHGDHRGPDADARVDGRACRPGARRR